MTGSKVGDCEVVDRRGILRIDFEHPPIVAPGLARATSGIRNETGREMPNGVCGRQLDSPSRVIGGISQVAWEQMAEEGGAPSEGRKGYGESCMVDAFIGASSTACCPVRTASFLLPRQPLTRLAIRWELESLGSRLIA